MFLLLQKVSSVGTVFVGGDPLGVASLWVEALSPQSCSGASLRELCFSVEAPSLGGDLGQCTSPLGLTPLQGSCIPPPHLDIRP